MAQRGRAKERARNTGSAGHMSSSGQELSEPLIQTFRGTHNNDRRGRSTVQLSRELKPEAASNQVVSSINHHRHL